MTMSIGEWLANTLSPDQKLREDATQKLEAAAKENFPQYVMMLAQELVNEGSASHVRSAAGIALKNTFVGGDQQRRDQMKLAWTNTDINMRQQVKMAVLQTLETQDPSAGSQAAQALASIALVELPLNLWPDLIEVLLQKTTGATNSALKKNTLMSIGYICENLDANILAAHSDSILTAVINGARKEEPNMQVRLTALRALLNSLEFIRNNFENREGERNFIMQVVCEATQSKDTDVEVAAFECLIKIMQLYYDKMVLYMEKALYGLTIFGMQSENERVALQAIEFWSTVCDEEIQIQVEIEEDQELGQTPTQVCHNFAAAVVKDLLPVLTFLLTKQEEDADEDEWTVAMAAGTCMSLLAQCVRDPIVPHALPFIEQNLRNQDWRYRDAAVMTFGSILEGPDPKQLGPLVQQALPFLIESMKDPSPQVKDTTAWTLGRVCEYLLHHINLDPLPAMIAALILGLQDNPRIAANCCWALMNLAERMEEPNEQTSILSGYFQDISTSLLKAANRPNNDGNVRTASYESLASLMTAAPMDCLPIVGKVTEEIIIRLEATIQQQNQLVSMDDRNLHNELQANLCSVLTSGVRRLGGDVKNVSDRIMVTLLSIFSAAGKQSTVLEDAFLAVGAVCTAIDKHFARYLDSFSPFLCNALQNHEEHQLCSIAVGLVSDICRALVTDAAPYCDMFMNLLLQDLQSPVLHRDVKPAILACFGDVALAIGSKFEVYLEVVFHVLQQACQLKADPNNYEYADYLLDLREGIVEAWVGIVQAFKAENKGNLIQPQVPIMMQTMYEMITLQSPLPDGMARAVAGLIGDLAETFKSGQVRDLLHQQWVEDFLMRICKGRVNTSSTRQVAKWARDVIRSSK
ncbi:putative karyopherin beta-1 subunit [Paraphysoderma sedebokerense]|nr:putative karyopherin beta-1 subunit [Paraphysoderma sedebokerense]